MSILFLELFCVRVLQLQVGGGWYKKKPIWDSQLFFRQENHFESLRQLDFESGEAYVSEPWIYMLITWY